MGLFSKLFGSVKNDGKNNGETKAVSNASLNQKAEMLNQQKQQFTSLVQEKNVHEAISEKELLNIFATYFAPNKEFYSTPGSPKYTAYFSAINSARNEMISHSKLFTEATKWDSSKLAGLLNTPQPGITNMLVCGLIFKLGAYAVIRDVVLCVDFSEAIPNCVALYLLLTAQKLPSDKRIQVIDAGDGTDKKPLSDAMAALKVCDPTWSYKIY